jgi:imidazolonepropionase-like amidohydrolase
MKILSPLLSLLACLIPVFISCQPTLADLQSADDIAFVNVNVLPMTSNEVLKNQTVIIKGGKIAQIGDAKSVKPPKGALKIKGKGKYLMPGISEMHAHIPVAQNGDDADVRETLFLYLSNGITVIRGMLGHPYHLELRRAIADGEVLGPRMFTSSPSLNGNTVQSKEEARTKVTNYAQDGYDFLKIHPGIKLDVFEELVRTANDVGITFSGHVPTAVGVHRAIDFGYASIDHLDGYVDGLVPASANVNPDAGGLFGLSFTNLADEKMIPELVQATKANNIWVVPTQALLVRLTSPKSGEEMMKEPEMQYINPGTRYQWRGAKQPILDDPNFSDAMAEKFIGIRESLLRQMSDAGVGLLLGSDAPQIYNVPGFSIQHEMQSMANAGISNFKILQSGTINPAKFLGKSGTFGQVTEGAAADLILLHENPLDDIENMQELAGVMIQGKWMPKKLIDKELRAIAEKYARE